MKESISNKLLLVCCLLTILSCHTRKLVTSSAVTVPVKPVNHIEDKLAAIRSQQINFNTFSGKAKTTLDINGSSNNVTLNIRINRDKEIWISVTALLGIEGARAVITPDSIMALNRLQGIYIKKPFSYIYKFTSKQVDFSMLQALFTGNAAPKLLNDSAKYTTANDTVTLNGALEDLVYKLILGSDLKVAQTNLSNAAEEQSLQVNNVFALQNNQKVPSQIDISSVAKSNKIEVNLHFVKVDYNQPQDYPFNIPDSYSPAE